MQVFMPYPDMKMSAEVLDDKRLNKQIVETYQILRSLCGITLRRGWRSHPAMKMWITYEPALYLYWGTTITEWVTRGNNSKFHPLPPLVNTTFAFPYWFGDEAFHRSHQSNLLRKEKEARWLDRSILVSKVPDKKHYSSRFPDVPDYLPYIWPAPRDPDPNYVCKNKRLVNLMTLISGLSG